MRKRQIITDVVISLLSTIAKQERIRISERVKAGLVYRKEVLKKPLGRKAGSRLKKTDKKISLASQLRSEGLSLGEIAQSMNISRQRVHQLLQMV
ncbi:MAG: sigma factor-like helix-turn-helix DNA-binding protein [Kiritimatiellales bacterium]